MLGFFPYFFFFSFFFFLFLLFLYFFFPLFGFFPPFPFNFSLFLHSFNTHISLQSSRSRDLLYSLIHFHNPFLLFPEALFVLHVNSNLLLIKESIKLQIPLIAIVDSNCNPYGIHFPIPGNDDSSD